MRFLGVVVLTLALAGCASANRGLVGNSQTRVVDSAELPAPTPNDLVGEVRPYLIGPFDRLIIDVIRVPDLNGPREVQTDANGRLSFPLVGVVDAGGKTPSQLGEILRERLRAAYIRDPQVTVNLKETGSQLVAVDGEVREPGLYPVVGRMTLMRAVATAKGVTEFARLSDVVVFRTVGGQKYAALYNLKAIRRGAYPDPEVYANDVVMVGDSAGRRLFRDFLGLVPLLSAPLVVALQ